MMNSRQRFKLGAGAGLVTMLLGALMVLAPGAGADHTETGPTPSFPDAPNVHCGADPAGAPIGLGFDHEIGFGGFEGSDEDIDSAVVDGVSWDSYVVDGVRHFDWTSTTHAILAVIVKQANGAAVFNYEPDGATSGTVYVGTGSDQTGISHIDFCYDGQTPEPEGTLIVRKDVVPDPDGDPQFGFDVSGPGEYDDAFDLGDGDQDSSTVPAGSFTITETDPGPGYTLDGVECSVNQNPFTPTLDGTSVTVDVPADATVDCTFTNVPVETPDEPELTVRKVVGDVEPSSWSFDFEICDQGDLQAASVSEVDGCDEFTLSRNNPGTEEAEHEKKFVAGVYDIAELGEDLDPAIVCTDSTGATVGDRDDGNGIENVDVTQLDVTCVFTNPGTPPPPPEIPTTTFSVDLEKLNDADDDGEFDDFEVAPVAGADVEFEISIENTGTGALTLATLTDTFDGETVDLLTEVDLECERAGASVTLSVGSVLPVGSTTVCTFTLDGYAPAAGTTLENVVAVGTGQAGIVTDESEVAVAEVLPEEEEPGSITIVKDVDGWEPDSGWTFGFNGSDGIGQFTLSDDDASTTFSTLEAGSYTFTEHGNSETTLVSIDCDGEDLVSEGRAVTVDLAEGEDVTCVFTNAFNPAPAEVLGVQTVRTLPRTGDETRNLAGVGALMLAMGAAMVLGSKRQLAR